MNGTSTLIDECGFNRSFSCNATKASRLTTDVILPKANEILKKDMLSAKFINLHFDSTTLHNTKILLIVAKVHQFGKKSINRVAYLTWMLKETAIDLVELIRKACIEANIDESKIVAITVDNTNTNYGGADHMGKKNVRALLKEKLGRKFLTIGCLGHICSNAVKHAIKSVKGI